MTDFGARRGMQEAGQSWIALVRCHLCAVGRWLTNAMPWNGGRNHYSRHEIIRQLISTVIVQQTAADIRRLSRLTGHR